MKWIKSLTRDRFLGLRILPNLLPSEVQEILLSRLLMRDLTNPLHQTNIHLHYNVPYPEEHGHSFFDMAESTVFTPKDSDIHKPLTLEDVLEKKLRWMTLGGQYNWTTKEYPDGPPVDFPPDIKKLVNDLVRFSCTSILFGVSSESKCSATLNLTIQVYDSFRTLRQKLRYATRTLQVIRYRPIEISAKKQTRILSRSASAAMLCS